MINENFLIVGAAVHLWGNLVYARHTLLGKTQPNRVSWFFWSFPSLIAFAAEIDQGAGMVSLLTFTAGFGALLVFLASFVDKKAYWKLYKADYVCAFLALIMMILWLLYRNDNIAIVFSGMIVLIAALPSLIKAYKHPRTESVQSYLGALINSVITILVIKNWTIASWFFPVVIFSLNVLFVYFISFKPGLKPQAKRA